MDISFPDLIHLVGTWSGTGRAEYPTITPVDFREELVFEHNTKDPALHYVQRTWRVSGEPLFWESGFLIDKGGGIFELVSAQKSGRVEVLRGPAARSGDAALVLALRSIHIVNDGRMITSQRVFRITTAVIEYEHGMSTQTHPAMARHVRSRLERSLRRSDSQDLSAGPGAR